MNYQQSVLEFQIACDVPLTNPNTELFDLCLNLIKEEFTELSEAQLELSNAVDAEDYIIKKAKVASEMVDLIYVICYAANVHKIPLDQVFTLIHKANMNKVDPQTGKVNKREDGKILKPEGWKPAPIKELIALQQACIDAQI